MQVVPAAVDIDSAGTVYVAGTGAYTFGVTPTQLLVSYYILKSTITKLVISCVDI